LSRKRQKESKLRGGRKGNEGMGKVQVEGKGGLE
jgi:hypothetical protein